jgi:predicted  nucleic acid-binding Zn-ribbon protein
MGKTPKIAILLMEKQKIEKEIEELQGSCQHQTKSVKNVRERLDSTVMVVRYVCDECYLIVGIPNNDNLQNFLKQ